MILSNLMTANNRLATAAAEMRARMVNRNRAEVFIKVALLTLKGLGYAVFPTVAVADMTRLIPLWCLSFLGCKQVEEEM
jgi:hypothetical protein